MAAFTTGEHQQVLKLLPLQKQMTWLQLLAATTTIKAFEHGPLRFHVLIFPQDAKEVLLEGKLKASPTGASARCSQFTPTTLLGENLNSNTVQVLD